ncbi:MAG: hypothetical protein ACXVZ2_12025 [Gaiellaceae bacterium]
MQHEQTWADVILGLLAFAAAAAALTCSFLALFADREELALAFAAAGVGLALWSGLRMLRGYSDQTDSPSARS